MKGMIIKNISNDYTVLCDGREYVCRARGKFRYNKLIPLVGDIVSFDSETNYILDIDKRKNELIRPSVSNVDNALIVVSVKSPNLDTNLLDRLLVIIEYNGINPIICFSKIDLLDSDELSDIYKYIEYYKSLGYMVFINIEVDDIKSALSCGITVFTGQSGAGKSSLLNKLDSSLNLNTSEISLALGRGKHTTRHTELFSINGGYVVDTPGFSSLSFNDMRCIDIRDNFRECYNYLDKCKYRDCMHVKEDGCYVKSLVSEGVIPYYRYDNYVKFIKEKGGE